MSDNNDNIVYDLDDSTDGVGPQVAASSSPEHEVELVTNRAQVPALTPDGDLDPFADYVDDSPLPPRRQKLMTPVTWCMVGACVAVGSFALGARVEKGRVPAANASSSARPGALTAAQIAAFAQGRGGAGAAGTGAAAAGAPTGGGAGAANQPAAGANPAGAGAGAAGAGGGFGGGTFGSVKLVDGSNVYIQDAQGNVIKVSTQPGLSVPVSKPGTVADLKPGDNVVVTGAADADGNIAATAIAPVAAGAARAGRTGAAAPGGGAATTTTTIKK